MSIEILPARLANQIAAGEVVERPASVIKELVENSLDAGATKITIEIDKGGAKRIKITDNGGGIAKDELTLALSRHATSKIKSLDDLEAIDSLGFRGEALASISSVARLTLTSKPEQQENAWQATAEGRDMQVNVQPAAHPNGTSIEVKDLFFNTPARRKFLRTEKTEFSHIDEVVRRIALARFDVGFTLVHNGNIIRQYRAAATKQQQAKRVAQICGQKFIDNALEVDCEHDNLTLTGWLASPNFTRNQNDLCYSYVNGRMMRDKLINHAIRQAYADLLPPDTYPAFVLFLTLDFAEVDVNVHPAKHEVRFHQGRYVHDFIYSVCAKALQSQQAELLTQPDTYTNVPYQETTQTNAAFGSHATAQTTPQSASTDYIAPLQSAQQAHNYGTSNGSTNTTSGSGNNFASYQRAQVSDVQQANYQKLMTPLTEISEHLLEQAVAETSEQHGTESAVQHEQPKQITQQANHQKNNGAFFFQAPNYLALTVNSQLRLLSLPKLSLAINLRIVQARWHQGMVSQPLLLPVKISLDEEKINLLAQHQEDLQAIGFHYHLLKNNQLQVRQFPALLRDKDISKTVDQLVDLLTEIINDNNWGEAALQHTFARLMVAESFNEATANNLLSGQQVFSQSELNQQLVLNSVEIDLTSSIKQLN